MAGRLTLKVQPPGGRALDPAAVEAPPGGRVVGAIAAGRQMPEGGGGVSAGITTCVAGMIVPLGSQIATSWESASPSWLSSNHVIETTVTCTSTSNFQPID